MPDVKKRRAEKPAVYWEHLSFKLQGISAPKGRNEEVMYVAGEYVSPYDMRKHIDEAYAKLKEGEDLTCTWGNKIMEYVARLGDMLEAQKLLDEGYDINTINPANLRTPLMTACRYNQPKLVRFLACCPDVSFEHRNKIGQTALQLACSKGHSDAVHALLSVHAERSIDTMKNAINLQTRLGMTTFHMVVAAAPIYGDLSFVETARKLFRGGMDLNLVDEMERLGVFFAYGNRVDKDYTPILRIFIHWLSVERRKYISKFNNPIKLWEQPRRTVGGYRQGAAAKWTRRWKMGSRQRRY